MKFLHVISTGKKRERYHSALCIGSLFLILSLCLPSTTKAQTIEIDSLLLRKHIAFLADDAMEGREAGKIGSQKSGEYISNQLYTMGATPLCEEGFQYFDLPSNVYLGKETKLSIGREKLKLKDDFLPSFVGPNASAKGNVVFVGFGITTKNDTIDWDDYKSVDVKGKWAMIISGVPYRDKFFRLTRNFNTKAAKLKLAEENGAVGVLFVSQSHNNKKDKPSYYHSKIQTSNSTIPSLSITRKQANKILNTLSIESVEKEFSRQKLSFYEDTHTRAEGTVAINTTAKNARNIVYELKSATPSNEYIIVGGHYDHVGRGFWGSREKTRSNKIHNGADDNASGTAAVIELARYFKSKQDELTKNIVFIAFDAEEMGLLGSKHFVLNPPMPIENIKVMFNFDMIARMQHDTTGITIRGTGTAKEFDQLLNKHTPKFRVKRKPEGTGPTDHASFYKVGIPVLSMSTGLHPEYHTPLDDIELCTIGKEKQLLDYAALLIEEFALRNQELTFIPKKKK